MDFKKGRGQYFKCFCVQENFEKLTLSGAFSDHFLRKRGGRGTAAPPPLTAYVYMYVGSKMLEINISLKATSENKLYNRKAIYFANQKTTFVLNIFLPDVPFQVSILIPAFILKF